MGAWGAGMYENDTALDIHSHLVSLLKDDEPLRTALTKTIKRYEGQHYSDVILGLAQEQVRYDMLVDEDILKQAWSICENRAEELVRWLDRDEDDAGERSKVLDVFQDELERFMLMNGEDFEDRFFIKKLEQKFEEKAK